MDGLTIGNGGGGYELGGGWVTIGADLEPLKDAVAQSERMISDLVGKQYVIKFEVDLASAKQAVADLETQIRNVFAGVGGGTSPVASAFQQIQQQLAAFQNVQAAGGGNLGMPLTLPAGVGGGNVVNNVVNNYNVTNVGSPGGGVSGAPGGGSSRRPWYFANPSRPGDLFRTLGAPVGIFYGLEAVGGFIQGEEAVQRIADHPEVQLYEMANSGSGYDLASNPLIQNLATENNQLQQTLEKRRTMGRIPLLGRYLSEWDVGDDSAASLEQKLKDNQAAASSVENAAALGYEAQGMQLQWEGDTPSILRHNQQLKLQAAREKASQAQTMVDNFVREHPEVLAQDSTTGGADYQRFTQLQQNSSTAGKMVDNFERAQQALAKMADSAQAVAQANREIQNSGLHYEIRGQQLIAQGNWAIAGNVVGSEDAARQLRQQGQREQIGGGFEVAMAQSGIFGLGRTIAQYGARASGVASAQGAENAQVAEERENQLLQIEARGQAARYRQLHNAFAAELELFEANASAEINVARRKGQAVLQATEYAIDSERQLLYQQQREAGQDIIAGAHLSISGSSYTIAAANYEMQGNPHAAAMLQFDQQQKQIDDERRKAERLPAIQRGIRYAELDAQENANNARRQNADYQYSRQGALIGYQLSTETAAAQYQIADMPMSAQMATAIEQARLRIDQITRANPKYHDQAVAAESEHLKAMVHEQYGYRSGGLSMATSSFDEALAATGFGMDLGGYARDRANVERMARNAAAPGGQLGQPIPGTQSPAPALSEAASDLRAAVAALKAALQRVTLFTSGS